jgi:hypothetical protein
VFQPSVAVVSATPETSRKASTSRRRWLFRLLFLPLVALLAAFITTAAWFFVAYRQLAGDLKSSRERLPTSISRSLVPAGDIVDEPQVTLAIASAGNRKGTAALAFRTDPGAGTVSLLSLPATTNEVDDAALIDSATSAIGASVNHVLFVSPRSLRDIVDELGPLTITNPSPVDYTLENGRYFHFPAGEVTLDGTRALAFMNGTGETTVAGREQLILERIVDSLLAPKTISELADTTRSVASSADTDLSPSDLVGLAWVRFHSDTIIRCRLTGATDLQTAVTKGERRVFLGRTSIATDQEAHGCRSRPLSESSLPLPPKSVIKAVGAAYPFWPIALAILVGGILLLLAFFFRAQMWSGLVYLAQRLDPRRLWHAARGARLSRPSLPSLRLRPLRAPRSRSANEPSPSMTSFSLTRFRPSWGSLGRAVPEWAIRNRGDIGLYLLVTGVAVGITFLILLSVA